MSKALPEVLLPLSLDIFLAEVRGGWVLTDLRRWSTVYSSFEAALADRDVRRALTFGEPHARLLFSTAVLEEAA